MNSGLLAVLVMGIGFGEYGFYPIKKELLLFLKNL